MSKCKTCGKEYNETDFYASIKSYCKEHWKERVRLNRAANADHYREFDKRRANLPHRVEARAA
jgi:recombinational DNA repair protein (RecF pathway)